MTRHEEHEITERLTQHIKSVWSDYHRKTMRDQWFAVAFCLIAVGIGLWIKG